MSFRRAAGVLLHPTSLPSSCGIGDLGSSAYYFADFLKSTGISLWQMLPVNPTGFGNSPYQCTSVFAGNPLLINLNKICDLNLLADTDIRTAFPFPDHIVDFEAVASFKLPLLTRAYGNFCSNPDPVLNNRFRLFCSNNEDWLEDFALFAAYKETRQSAQWTSWQEDIRLRNRQTLQSLNKQIKQQIDNHKFQQFLFFEQWNELKKYCNSLGIQLIGDIPIFVSPDSDAVWAHPEYFNLNEDGSPKVVAGVPPDYFSSTGQLWGNPLYNWEKLEKDGYNWWIKRFAAAFSLFDIVRIDHFRGFESYWEIPGNAHTAVNGRWVKGPGMNLFKAVKNVLGDLPIIAEDLGIITPDVEILRDELGIPGMKVLQFAFGDDNYRTNSYLPHNFIRNCVVYTGTHDNNTTMGWFRGDNTTTLSREDLVSEKQRALSYLNTDGHDINWDFIRLAFMSVADTAVVPMQDFLGLGSDARMNIPGSISNNWKWRFTADMITEPIRQRMRQMTLIYGR
jgi:4-alpha-glucanotransferase